MFLSVVLAAAAAAGAAWLPHEHAQVGPHCEQLRSISDTRDLQELHAYYLGIKRNVSIYWNGLAPSRAAAALLTMALRYGLRYSGVHLRCSPPDLCDLQYKLCIHEPEPEDYEFPMDVSTRSRPDGRCEHLPQNCTVRHGDSGYDGRLEIVGVGAAPSQLWLHAYLAPSAVADLRCLDAYHSWQFYRNFTLLKQCKFLDPYENIFGGVSRVSPNSYCAPNLTCTVVLLSNENEDTARTLLEHATTHQLPLAWRSLGYDSEWRRHLLPLLRTDSRSFLFLDYDLWADQPGARYMPPPPCAPNTSCSPILDRVDTFRVADIALLQQRAPPIYDVFRRFQPNRAELREITELEIKTNNTEEAACAWALRNPSKFGRFYECNIRKFLSKKVIVFLCANEMAHEYYTEVLEVYNDTISDLNYNLIRRWIDDCSDAHALELAISDYKKGLIWNEVAGIVAAGEGAEWAASTAVEDNFVLVLYDTPRPAVPLGPATYAASGTAVDLWRAYKHFLDLCGWKRLVILSERSLFEKDFEEDFFNMSLAEGKLAIRKRYVKSSTAVNTLRDLQEANARIFLVNGNVKTAHSVLCAASELGMTPTAGYAWILRDRPPSDKIDCENASISIKKLAYFTISYWWSGGNDSSLRMHKSDGFGARLRAAVAVRRGAGPWPRLVAPLLDALQLLVQGHVALLSDHPQYMFELHSDTVLRDFSNSLRKTKIIGVTQDLSYDKYSLKNPIVFVDEWRGGKRNAIAMWRVVGDSVEEMESLRPPYTGAPPTDGSAVCFTTHSGDAFQPRCHDAAWAVLAVALVLAPPALYAARRARIARLARRYRLMMAQLQARRNDAFAELAAHLVDKEELELLEVLGSGRFGLVHLAMLRSPNCVPLAVAAKKPHANADENEILHEARILASLKHENIVRFVGVCSTGASVLVLMEHAFHGDLLRYLRARRHLVERERAGVHDEEAEHVSATALTRMAREAAAALGYLADCRVVHRDVRASNCLVDIKRTLKLADFGMARELSVSVGDLQEYTYTCQRRALFPVQAMAPESLERGVFSSASDVWALGVLLVELATLGARPYGEWAPVRVLRHVQAGGGPRLPRDATPQLRAVAALCWRRELEQRPSAAQVVAYLASHRRAVAPALHSLEPPTPADTPRHDSGFSEHSALDNDIS